VTETNRHLIWLGVLALGLLMIAAVFTRALNPPQCPPHVDPDDYGSRCIIGANMGAGMLWITGIAVAFVGFVGSLVSLVASLWERR